MAFPAVQSGSMPAGALNCIHLVLSEVIDWQLVEGDGPFPHYLLQCFNVMTQWLLEFLTVPADSLEQLWSLRRMPAQLGAMKSPYIGGAGAFIFILPASMRSCEAPALKRRNLFSRSAGARRKKYWMKIENFKGRLWSVTGRKYPSLCYHEDDKFIIIVYSCLSPSATPHSPSALSWLVLLHIIMINKNQSKRNIPEPPPPEPSPPQASNTTTSKQRNSMHRMQEEMQQAPLFELSPVEESLIDAIIDKYQNLEDPPIEPDADQHHISPEDNCVSSPRRSLIKQNEIWAAVEGSTPNSPRVDLKTASDEYYNENVPHQTLLFLERLRSVLILEEEGLVERRKGKLQNTVTAIRAGFARLREHLLAAVQAWSRRAEQLQVQGFLQKGELAVSGQLLEVGARMAARRQEIEQRLAALNEGLAQAQMTPREEALHRNQLVKQTVREVWQKDYEQEVLQLQEEASLLKISESSHAIMFQRSYNYKQMLHAAIEDVFTYHQPFKTPREDSKPVVDMSPPVKKKEDLSLSPASTHRQQILQSLMEERMKQINAQSRLIMEQYQLGAD